MNAPSEAKRQSRPPYAQSHRFDAMIKRMLDEADLFGCPEARRIPRAKPKDLALRRFMERLKRKERRFSGDSIEMERLFEELGVDPDQAWTALQTGGPGAKQTSALSILPVMKRSRYKRTPVSWAQGVTLTLGLLQMALWEMPALFELCRTMMKAGGHKRIANLKEIARVHAQMIAAGHTPTLQELSHDPTRCQLFRHPPCRHASQFQLRKDRRKLPGSLHGFGSICRRKLLRSITPASSS
jgi:hypothetical protein